MLSGARPSAALGCERDGRCHASCAAACPVVVGIVMARVVAAAIRRLFANQLGLAHAVRGGLPIERLAHFVTCNKKLER